MIKTILNLSRRMVKHLRNNNVLPWSVIIALTISDFFSMCNMLSSSTTGVTKGEQFLYSFVLALCLEGLPVVIGRSLSTLQNSTTYWENEKKNAKYGLCASLFGLIIAIALVVGIRIAQIQKNGGYHAYKENDYHFFVIHCVLCVLPILTSFLAFAISWMFLRSERIDEQEQKNDKSNT